MNDSQQLMVALVTGANRGIGLEVVRQLAEKGMTVVMGTRNLEKGQAVAAKLIKQGFNVLPYQLDVADPKSINHLAKWVDQEFRHLDILVIDTPLALACGDSSFNVRTC